VSQAMRLLIPSTRGKGKGASAPYGIENIKKDIASGYLICVRCNPPPPPSPPPNPNPSPNTNEGSSMTAQQHTGIQRYLHTSTPSSCSADSMTAHQPVSKRIRQSATIPD
jgi:hypothetical protein